MTPAYEKAKSFIYRNARPLDFARWRFHFENGSAEEVIKCLAAYQNADGGFGHALEADSWNPHSTPIQTWTATEILREIAFTDAEHPMVKGILNYLGSGKDFTGHLWYNTVKSNNDYPHAPWWHTESDSTCHNDYNPTACLAGFIIRFSERTSELYQLGARIAKEAFAQFVQAGRINDMHTLLCFIRLMQYCREANAHDVINLAAMEQKAREDVKGVMTQDRAEWETSYVSKPSQFFNTNSSIFYGDNKEIADFECEFILKSQLSDGSWNIPWGWNDYKEQWAISKSWWKANGIILNLLYLKGLGN